MPEVFRREGYVVYFYSNEGHEPMHVHVRKGRGRAKFWVDPLMLDYARHFKVRELGRAEELVAQHMALIVNKWHEAHGA